MALSGKVALVTGASQGLGKGFSDILLKNGAKVAMLDINETVGKTAKADFDKEYGEDRTVFLKCDVTSAEQLKDAFQKTIERFGGLHIVANNAGILDESDWEKTVQINLNGVIRGTYLALQHMKKGSGGGGGVIVNTASIAGLGPLLTSPVYTATKHGVVGFTRAMADASKASDYGVRINALCPTFVRTPILDFLTNEKSAGQFGDLLRLAEQLKQMAGVLEVPDVAERFLQLVTDEEKNGAVMMVTLEGGTVVSFPELFKVAVELGPPSQ
ncbi:15-hydroxyprostaglandin dehydrogenase [NAD(+)]-like [Anguilla rostrata]|uniref:15-hydroxyprostaglandin dehydrogenase [NAD(+)]-like n=1 Tax=Anguilla rostrata TaxID=7938 RepID=UPI0030CCAC52